LGFGENLFVNDRRQKMNEKEQPLLKPKRGTGPTPDSTNIVLSSKATGRDIVNTWISVLEKMAQDEEAFEYIRSTYFPQWDTARKWTMRNTHPDCVGFGLCDSKGKMIVVRNSPPGGPQVALIHEICHAVASIYHDKKWQRRMEMAALKAESIGDKELAAEIRKEYTAYFDPDRSMKPTAEMVYNQSEMPCLILIGLLRMLSHSLQRLMAILRQTCYRSTRS
jgi:hypothetical protein